MLLVKFKFQFTCFNFFTIFCYSQLLNGQNIVSEFEILARFFQDSFSKRLILEQHARIVVVLRPLFVEAKVSDYSVTFFD